MTSRIAGIKTTILIMLWTFSGTGALWFYWQAQYESATFQRIVLRYAENMTSDTEKGLALLHAAHELLEPRAEIYKDAPYDNPVESIFRSPIIDLIDAKGGKRGAYYIYAEKTSR